MQRDDVGLGARLGEYLLEARLADGPFSWVYRGVARSGAEACAIKLAKPSYYVPRGRPAPGERTEAHLVWTGWIGGHLPDTRQLLALQARKLASTADPALVRLDEFVESEEAVYYRMEYVEGRTLRSVLEAGAAPVRVLLDLARAMERLSAHPSFRVHGDLKPENILVGAPGVKLIDPGHFGLGEVAGRRGREVVTTTAYYPYLAPDDLFAFGILLWEGGCGRNPFLSSPSESEPARGLLPPGSEPDAGAAFGASSPGVATQQAPAAPAPGTGVWPPSDFAPGIVPGIAIGIGPGIGPALLPAFDPGAGPSTGNTLRPEGAARAPGEGPALGEALVEAVRSRERNGDFFLSPLLSLRRPAALRPGMHPAVESLLLRGLRLRLRPDGRLDVGPGFESFGAARFALERLAREGIDDLRVAGAPRPAADAPRSPAPAVCVGTVPLGGRIGRGEVSDVFEGATPGRDGGRLAVKVLRPEFSEEREVRRRFLEKGEVAASLRHPNLVDVVEVDAAADPPRVVARLVEGTSLARVLERERGLFPDRALAVLRQVGEALEYAHARGVVHGDLRPSRILLGRGDAVTLLGFRMPGRLAGAAGAADPRYAAPEHLEDPKVVDPRMDVYSLAALAFEVLAGRTPYASGDAWDLLRRKQEEPPPGLAALLPGVPEALDALLRRSLARSPAVRPASARAFVDAFERALCAGEGPTK
ncbi:MAG: protein kinase [Planctomycetes bacterium]|nr:protein kinase [Planctomycetota bacterium]